MIEEIPSGAGAPFHSVVAHTGGNLAVVYPDADDSYMTGYQNGPSGFIGESVAFPGGPSAVMYAQQVDLYAMPATSGETGFFWWTNASNDDGGGNFYYNESGFAISPGASDWMFTTTTGGQPFVLLPAGQWYHLEVVVDRTVPLSPVVHHRIYNANRTVLLYDHTLPYAPAFAGAILGGPMYTWFTVWDNDSVDRLYIDNLGKRSFGTGAATIDLVATDTCLNASESQLVVEVRLSNAATNIVGGEFYLSYDAAALTLASAEPGDAADNDPNNPFATQVFECSTLEQTGSIPCTPIAGEIDYAVGVSPFTDPGTSADVVMARLTFNVAPGTQRCNVANLVSFRAHTPPSQLSDGSITAVPSTFNNLGALTIDQVAPTIPPLPDVTVECEASDPSALPGVPFGSANGGVYIAYNNPGVLPETPANQSYLKAQFSQVNTNGAHLFLDSSSLPPYNIPGLSWRTLFSGLPVGQSQLGLDMVLLAPSYNGSNPPAPLIAYDNTNGTCLGRVPAGPVVWAVNDYKEGGAPFYGPDDPTRCIVNSLFRGSGPGAVVISKNIVTLSGTVFTAEIAGYLQSDGLIYWFNPATPNSPVSNLGLNGRFYFKATLTYNSLGDPGNDGDFYQGTLLISANSPFTGIGQTVGIPAPVTDNCTALPTVTFSDAVVPGLCPQEKTITRTWSATDACGNVSTDVQIIEVVDTTAPTVVYCPPAITLDADVGTCEAVLTLAEIGTALSQDCCDASAVTPVAMVGSRPGGVPLTAPYPTGTTVITWTAMDLCGNVSTCTQDITVIGVNDMIVDVAIENAVPSMDFTRCITFELWDCVGGSLMASVPVNVTFVDGVALNVAVEIPCGSDGYNCITARDVKHTLRSTSSSFGIVGAAYEADFTGAGDVLVPGNLNGDVFIDILDFGIFVGQYNTSPGADTPCGYVGLHADFSGNGSVFAEDYTFISNNFLRFNEGNCCTGVPDSGGSGVGGRGPVGPITRISVSELRRRGLHDLIRADLNRDGWLDMKDVSVFENGG